MKTFCFTVDDNIRFFKEITEARPESLFDHPYLAVYKRLHERFGLKVQLNLFYRMRGFELSRMTDAYRAEWQANADWLKLSFHSDYENFRPYEASGYDEVYGDCAAVHREILRFAGEACLADTTTVHYCLLTQQGLQAMKDNRVIGLLGLFGSENEPRSSYELGEAACALARCGEVVRENGMAFAAVDIVLNVFSKEENLVRLEKLLQRPAVRVMIHEQYFYPDYKAYQPDFEEKLAVVFACLQQNDFVSTFFEEQL